MIKIIHRVNTIEQLASCDKQFGVEMDLHGFGDRLVVHHDALCDGPDLVDWLSAFRHRFVIFNIKEEGIENAVRSAAAEVGLENYFFLDLSFPALIKMVRKGERRVAVRVSEFEPIAGALTLANQADWVWIDVFKGWFLSRMDYLSLREAGFKLCLVSPELHGDGRGEREIIEIRELMAANGFTIDAVCTKRPDLWEG
jgi:hypothetical protein